MQDLKQSTAFTVSVGPCLDSAGAEYTGLVIGDLSIRKHDGTVAAMAAAATITHSANGVYTLVGTTGNSDTVGRLQVHCNKATYQIPLYNAEVLHANVYDVKYGSTAPSTLGGTAQTGDAFARLGAPAGASVSVDVAAVKAQTAAIETDTQDLQTQVGTAGAGLTNINLPNQTMDITGDITGNLSGSVGSVTGAVGSVTGAVTVGTNNDKTGYALSGAGVQAIWDALTSALTTVGSIGKWIVDKLDVVLSTRASQTSVDDVPTNAEFNARTLAAADYFDPAADKVQLHATQPDYKPVRALRSATAQAGGASTITLDASASASDNIYNDCTISIISGTGAGEQNLILSYNGTTKVATVHPGWAVNPDNTSVFEISAGGSVDVHLFDGVQADAYQFYTDYNAGALNTAINGAVQSVSSGVTLADDAIQASKVAASAVTEIQAGLATAAALATPAATIAKLETAVELDVAVYRFTANALEQAPAGGGGGGVADWTADERTAIKTILGVPGSGSTPIHPTDGVLKNIYSKVVLIQNGSPIIVAQSALSGGMNLVLKKTDDLAIEAAAQVTFTISGSPDIVSIAWNLTRGTTVHLAVVDPNVTATEIANSEWEIKLTIARSLLTNLVNGMYSHGFIATYAGGKQKEIASGKAVVTL